LYGVKLQALACAAPIIASLFIRRGFYTFESVLCGDGTVHYGPAGLSDGAESRSWGRIL